MLKCIIMQDFAFEIEKFSREGDTPGRGHPLPDPPLTRPFAVCTAFGRGHSSEIFSNPPSYFLTIERLGTSDPLAPPLADAHESNKLFFVILLPAKASLFDQLSRNLVLQIVSITHYNLMTL